MHAKFLCKRFTNSCSSGFVLYCYNQLYIHIYMQEHNGDTIKTSGHTSLEKYTSHIIWKGCVWEGVGDWTELQHNDPHSMAITAFLSRSPGLLNRGPRGLVSLGHGPHSSIFSPNATAQLGAWGPPSAGCWFSLPHLISNWLELPVHRVILLFYAHSISSYNWPMEYATSAVFGMACLIIIERK